MCRRRWYKNIAFQISPDYFITTAVFQSVCISAQAFGMKKGSESSKLSEIAFVGQYMGTLGMEILIFFFVHPAFDHIGT